MPTYEVPIKPVIDDSALAEDFIRLVASDVGARLLTDSDFIDGLSTALAVKVADEMVRRNRRV